MTAASAAYLNKALQLTAYSLRSSLAAASGSGSCLAFGPTPLLGIDTLASVAVS